MELTKYMQVKQLLRTSCYIYGFAWILSCVVSSSFQELQYLPIVQNLESTAFHNLRGTQDISLMWSKLQQPSITAGFL